MDVVLVRHPAADIRPGICYGRLDIPLHPAAAAGLGALADRVALRSIARVWTSPARRCRALADAVASRTGLVPVIDARLLELDFGTWEGLPWDDVTRADLDAWAAAPLDFAPPGGETGRALLARITAFAITLRAAREDCVVVTHGGPLKLLAPLLRGEPPDLLAPAPPLGSRTAITL